MDRGGLPWPIMDPLFIPAVQPFQGPGANPREASKDLSGQDREFTHK